MEIRTRFAPSPTGSLHIGGLRTALYNYIFAKKNNGSFILRIEDTDQKRLVKHAKTKIIEALKIFDIEFDEGPGVNEKYGPYEQSKRLNLYKFHYIELIKNNFAYLCYIKNKELIPENNINRALEIIKEKDDSESDDTTEFVIKFKIPPKGKMKTYDELRGEVIFDLSLIDDPIIIKSDGFPTYHFANVVDDYSMKISHVIRGEEWLSSFPKHLLLYKSFGWSSPKFIHLPLLLNSDKSKLSKRQGDVDAEAFLKKGYLQDAIINFIALLGWHPNNDNEIFTRDQLIKNFSIEKIQKSGAIFDIKKLDWMNSQYIKNLEVQELIDLFYSYINNGFDLSDNKKLIKIFSFIKNRITTLKDIPDLMSPFYEDFVISDKEILDCINNKESQMVIKYWHKNLLIINDVNEDLINTLIIKTSNDLNCNGKKIFYPLRAILFGQFHGPDLYTIISILGINETKKRLEKYI